jgi:hypothetical protein
MTGYIYSLVLLIMFQPVLALAQLSDAQKAEIAIKNILVNSGFESGRSKWTASGGSFLAVSSGSNLLIGKGSVTWDSSGATQTLTSTALTVPRGLYGRNGLASCLVQTPSGTETYTMSVFDGTNTLVSTDVVGSTTPVRTSANFIFPSSGTISIRFTSVAADEPLIAIDDCYLGDATNISNVSQASFIGSAVIPGTASCDWTRTNTAFGAFGTVAACPGPTVLSNPGPGVIQTTDADLPRFTVNGLPAGTYQVRIIGYAGGSTAGGFLFRISDGTTNSLTGFGNANTGATQFTADGIYTYTAAGNRTFELQGLATTGTVNLFNANASYQLSFQIFRYPSSSEQAFTADTVAWKLDLSIGASGQNFDLGTANQASYIPPNNGSMTLTVNTSKGSAPAGISCSSTNDNTVGSTTCSAGSEEPGFVANFPRAGLVEVCYAFSHLISIAAGSGDPNVAFQVVRTANGSQTIVEEGGEKIRSRGRLGAYAASIPNRNCGTFQIPTAGKHTIRLMYEQITVATINSNLIAADLDATIGQPDVKITARYIDQSMPAPMIRNSVVTSSSGVWGHEAAYITYSAGTPSVTTESGDWLGALTDNGVGDFTAVIQPGVFSGTPVCVCNSYFNGGGCSIDDTTAISSTTVRIQAINGAGSAADNNVFLLCHGPK